MFVKSIQRELRKKVDLSDFELMVDLQEQMIKYDPVQITKQDRFVKIFDILEFAQEN